MAVALVVAAGRGERLGSEGPKAFVLVGGRPMLEWSLDALRAVPELRRIVVALPEGAAAPPGTTGVTGGEQRSHSVANALAAARDGDGDGDVVLVHDAARPLVDAALVRRCLRALEDEAADAVTAAAAMADTVKEAGSDHRVVRTLDRSRLWAVQTPQVFRRAALERALSAGPDALAAATDDASLVEAQGGRVAVVPAPRWNFKVTTPEDLAVADLLLRQHAPAGATISA